MMKEIEILVKVLESKKSALKKLKGYKRSGVKKIIDTYYFTKVRRSPRKWLRIRRDGKTNYITYKKDVFKNGKWSYSDEHETAVGDFKTMDAILRSFGYKPLFEINNTRTVFLYKNLEIVLEDVKGLGLFLEVERKNYHSGSVAKIRREIEDFINSTGIKVTKEMHKGKPELMMEKQS